ncbi:hypothetical protein PV04_05533 [Phialophora macrospora]|uniref:Heterokaryon incompatibility domain-containing protein n=1 Tax=Phialophora macrospora TaxID=1851006 RepID=A0A0D2FT08_9EURO|nr:hypothetical protein PV04_05533 [Phialophora macrospora]
MSADNFITTGDNYWPRRLLHVHGDHLTSIKRSGHSTYDGTEAPTYNILSYTWGRWETEHGEALPVQNVEWDIPAVRPEGFTVRAFHRVVKRVSQGGSHIWLDVACIDQENKAVKMSEIGKQAAIFRRARQVYIWLSHSKREVIGPILARLLDRKADPRPDRNGVANILQDIRLVFSDPWFSSLWVLQESFLRPGAVLLFKDASSIDIPGARGKLRPCSLFDIYSGFQRIAQALQYEIQHSSGSLGTRGVEKAREAIQRLDDAGVRCTYYNNAISLYAVSTIRNPRDEKDRIYGIMQVFGFVLGTSANPSGSFNLDDLEDQLGEALNKACPVFAQNFVHLGNPRPGRSWYLHRELRVLLEGRITYTPRSYCEITFSHTRRAARFQGPKIRFPSLCSTLTRHLGNRPLFEYVYFDATTQNRAKLPRGFTDVDAKQLVSVGNAANGIGDALEDAYGSRVSVFLIGSLQGGGQPEQYAWLGVLAYPRQVRGEGHDRETWTRIGVSLWSLNKESMRSEITRSFKTTDAWLS